MTPTGSTFVRVVRSAGGGWDVREPGSARALCHADTQLEAVRLASRVLSPVGGQIRVLDGEGFLERTSDIHAVPGAKRWWYLPHWGVFLALGLGLLTSGILRVVTGPTSPWLWLGGALQSIGCVGVVVCALASRQRRRADMKTAIDQIERDQADHSRSTND